MAAGFLPDRSVLEIPLVIWIGNFSVRKFPCHDAIFPKLYFCSKQAVSAFYEVDMNQLAEGNVFFF